MKYDLSRVMDVRLWHPGPPYSSWQFPEEHRPLMLLHVSLSGQWHSKAQFFPKKLGSQAVKNLKNKKDFNTQWYNIYMIFFSYTLEYEIVSFVYKINMHNFTRPRTHAFDNKVPRTSPIHRWRTCRTRLSFCSHPLRSNSDKFRCSLLRTSHLHSLF